MFCRKCGNELPNHEGYCPKCGHPVDGLLSDIKKKSSSVLTKSSAALTPKMEAMGAYRTGVFIEIAVILLGMVFSWMKIYDSYSDAFGVAVKNGSYNMGEGSFGFYMFFFITHLISIGLILRRPLFGQPLKGRSFLFAVLDEMVCLLAFLLPVFDKDEHMGVKSWFSFNALGILFVLLTVASIGLAFFMMMKIKKQTAKANKEPSNNETKE